MIRASLFRVPPLEARRSVRFPRLWIAVDKWITCGLFPGGLQRVQDAAWQERPAGDESGEEPARGRARREGQAGALRAVDTAGGDDLEPVAEALAHPADV